MVRKTIVDKVRRFERAIIKSGIRVTKVIVYGSQASGQYRRDSDIDVAIVSPDFGKDRTEEGMNLFRLAGHIDPRIEPVPVSERSFYKDTWVPLIYEIRSKGIEVSVH